MFCWWWLVPITPFYSLHSTCVCPGVRYHDDVQWSGVGLHCRLESEIQVFEVLLLMAKLTSWGKGRWTFFPIFSTTGGIFFHPRCFFFSDFWSIFPVGNRFLGTEGSEPGIQRSMSLLHVQLHISELLTAGSPKHHPILWKGNTFEANLYFCGFNVNFPGSTKLNYSLLFIWTGLSQRGECEMTNIWKRDQTPCLNIKCFRAHLWTGCWVIECKSPYMYLKKVYGLQIQSFSFSRPTILQDHKSYLTMFSISILTTNK